MRFSRPPLHAGRVLIFTALLLLMVEAGLRMVTLYPFVPQQRFNFLVSDDGIAPSGRQLAEAVDQVRAQARPGDWVFLGDSVLNGGHVPKAGSPAHWLRQRITPARVWDLTFAGEDPAIAAALLARLGTLPGVHIVTNAGVKLMAHYGSFLYFVQLWDEMAGWSTTPPALATELRTLVQTYLDQYAQGDHQRTYGENVGELRAVLWMNRSIAVYGLDHWFRYHFCAKPWSQALRAWVTQGWPVVAAKDTDTAGRHEPIPATDSPEAQARMAWWWGMALPDQAPMWRAYLIFLDQIKEQNGLLNLHTIAWSRLQRFAAEPRAQLENAYVRMRTPAQTAGLRILEPNLWIPPEHYTDADHFDAEGNRRWVERLLETLP